MPSTPPTNTEDRPERTPAAGTPATAGAGPERVAPAPVPMRALLASCRAAEAVSTPPERDAAAAA
ncbi:hypothetical protein Kpho02_36250 [Kitasatospora phosalacinea]|uniref:Uncharacterized protein n=1 Tax=Kitasatospora phosalacinea TaxID=2065 RepID=A0A9W6V152_9ACTN|nr:hypothetical protein [Kitasatospora phosalacinea]GLW71326.1 hypothetical protein Kpho02_36250 [Kitasatospora phosalacinea]